MKATRFLSILLAALAVVSLASGSVSAAHDYDALFERLDGADGAYSELLACDLADAFDGDAASLLSALAELPDGKLDKAIYLLVYGKSYSGLDAFATELESLKTGGVSESRLAVIGRIEAEISQFGLWSGGSETVSHAFDDDTIIRFIDRNEASGNFDEAYLHVLGEAFRAEPEYFSQVVSALSEDVAEHVAEGVAYDCIRSASGLDIAELYGLRDDAFISNVLKCLSQEHVYGTRDWSCGSPAAPIVGVMTYGGALGVNAPAALNVTFAEASTGMSRTYWVEIYTVKNGVSTLSASKFVTVPPGCSSISTSFPLSFSSPGEYFTQVSVYSNRGGGLLSSRQGTYSDFVYG